jgi:hypothetical protein
MCFKGQSLKFLMMGSASIFFRNSVLNIKIRNFGLLKVHPMLQSSESLVEELLEKNLSQILFAIG